MSYETITTVCPYCGTGCLIDCTVDRENNRVIEAKGSPHGVNNDGRLCLKGLYGWDYLNDPKILTKRNSHSLNPVAAVRELPWNRLLGEEAISILPIA